MIDQQYITDFSQLCYAEKVVMQEGKAKGMTFVNMYNGIFHISVSVDQAMNIYQADYRGKNMVFKSKNGIVNPKLSSDAVKFLNDFGGGLFYTCGLDNIGGPNEGFVQHGSISYLPADFVNITKGNNDDHIYYVEVSGEIKYTSLFGSNLILKRAIRMYYNEPNIWITDEIINRNFNDDQYMLMYHFNFGYPFINENTTLSINETIQTRRLNEQKNVENDNFCRLEKPQKAKDEEVFIHTLKNEKTNIDVDNQIEILNLSFDNHRLKYLTQWKSMASGDYVLGIEPATCQLDHRGYTMIKAFDQHRYQLKISVHSKKTTKGENNE
ncbi:MAG: DUF4432 family protein [Acholeplasmataceae bacterium]